MKKDSNNIKIFWSWQSDSSTTCNRNFIESCLKKAISKIKKNSAQLIEIDRDTKGVGGTPRIADTILEKIREADLFIWDATLCYEKPRPAPNPNVLFELGYAISHLGEKRIIGVMNIANGLDGNFLPFDLKHRRWPIAYALNQESNFKKRITKLFKYDFGYEKKKKTEAEKYIEESVQTVSKARLKNAKRVQVWKKVKENASQGGVTIYEEVYVLVRVPKKDVLDYQLNIAKKAKNIAAQNPEAKAVLERLQKQVETELIEAQ
jgi:hypothetical protein